MQLAPFEQFENALVTLFLLVLIVFLIVNVLPSNPARQILGPFAPQSQVDAVNEEIGFTDPKLTQFGRLIKGAVTFDYGESYQFKVPVSELLWPALGRSAKLVVLALIMTILLAIAAGFAAARRRNTLTMFAGKEGGPLAELGSTEMAPFSPMYVGLGVCAHDDDAETTALFSDVTVEPLPQARKK